MPVRKTGALPEPIDRQVNEIIRAFSEMEEQVKQIRKALDPRIGDNAEYIDRHVRNLNNPHSVTAKQVKALPLAFVLDPSSICFPFQNSLVSTRGETPIGLYGSSITDYGLVTGNDLCATLLPEGGVAVTEGTTNIIDPKPEAWSGRNGGKVEKIDLYKMRVTNPAGGQWGRGQSLSFTVGNGETVTISGYIEGYAGYVSFQLRDIASGVARIELVIDSVGYYHGTWTNDLGNDIECQLWLTVYGEYNPDGQQYIIADKIQVEKKPYATPFSEGTRSPGKLYYPAHFFNESEGSFAVKAIAYPYTIGDRYITIQWGKTDISASSRFGLHIDSDGKYHAHFGGADTIITVERYDDGEEHLIVLTWKNGTDQIHLYVDGILVGSASAIMTLTGNGRHNDMIPVGHRGYTHNDQWFNNGVIKNLLICPYSVSPETIATWHSLDAPFIDPFVPPSQGVPYFNTPDEFINSTANFAMVNVDGLVKLYARTPYETIIIETSGNTEVV